MRQKLLFIFLLFFLFSSPSKAQDFRWVRQFGDQGKDEAEAMDVDSNGNSYSIGVAQSYTYDLDPTPNGTQIINNLSISFFSPFRDIYLVKLNNNGDFVWGKTFGGIKYDQYAYDIKIGSDGNIYVFLQTSDSITNNQFDQFITIVKISPDGNELSRIKIKNPGSFFTDHFDIDNQNNILVSGWFVNSKTLNFKNGNETFGAQNNIASYIFKLDNSGNFIWKKIFDTPKLSNVLFQTKLDGNIIAVLNSSDQSYPICSILNIDTNNTNVIWEKKLSNQSINTFHLDLSENIVIAGTNETFQGAVDVDPSSNVVNTPSQKFLLWFDNNGDFLDLKEYFVTQYSADFRMIKIESDAQNNIYVVGDFAGKVDADPSSNKFFLENPFGSIQYGSGYAIKFDSNRNFATAYTLISDYRSLVKDIKVKNKSIYLLGDFNDVCDFDPGVGDQTLSSLHNGIVLTSDGFVVKLGACDNNKPIGDADQYFCSNQNSKIENLIPNSNTILWYDSATSTIPIANITTLIDDKIYFAAKKEEGCPESTERLAVTVHIIQSPATPNASNQEFCEKTKATLTNITIVGTNIKWYDSLNSTNELPNSTLLQNNTTYYATQTINGCESNKTPITITIKPNPTPTTTSPQTFCIQQNATINDVIITGQNIKWYNALTNGILLANTDLLQDGLIYYASQTINGCESERAAVVVNIQNTPVPTANSSQSFCSTQNATLNDIATTGTAIKWYSAITNGSVLPSTTSLQDGVTYYATQTINSCESTSRTPVTISLINTLNATNYSKTICDDQNNGFETIDLSNYNSHLIGSSTETFRYYTLRNAAENQISPNQITNYSNYNLTIGQHIFYVRIDSPNTCHQIVELQLTLVSKPIINIPDIVPICENNSVTIDAGAGSDTYLWSNGASTSSITVTNPENFSVTVTKNYGAISCSSTKNFTVKKSNKATITSIETKDWTDNQNVITVFVSGSGDFEYSIDGTHFQNSNQFSNAQSGKYTVSVRDKNGCGTATDEVYLLMYPKFFTPNGDRYNDTWKIKFSDIEKNLTVKIFDRYGKLIKTLANYSSEWDGTFNGIELPATDYWFVVTRANGTQYKGHFSLKR